MTANKKEQKHEEQMARERRRSQQAATDRKNRLWIYGTGVVLIVALIATVTTVLVNDQQHKKALLAAANKPIVGVQSFTGLGRKHVTTQIAFPQTPPVGGDHSANVVNCGVYTTPVNNWRAVHSMEHGAVWVTYRPGLPAKEISALASVAKSHPYELLSPYPGLPAPIVASAWGKQLTLQSASDPRLAVFLQAYLQGPQTPELGAPCSGGMPG